MATTRQLVPESSVIGAGELSDAQPAAISATNGTIVSFDKLAAAAAVERAAVDVDPHPVGIDAVAFAVAALGVDDGHLDPRRRVAAAGRSDDRLRRRLANDALVGGDEGHVLLVDDQRPGGLGAVGVI